MSDSGFVPARRKDRSPAGPLAPWIIGGALMLLALSERSRVGQGLRVSISGLDWRSRKRLQPRTHASHFSPTILRERILGRPKAHIAAEFGPPRTAAYLSDTAVAQPAFWRGDTWYYAIDPNSELAMAVTFENDEARAVEFFQGPAGE